MRCHFRSVPSHFWLLFVSLVLLYAFVASYNDAPERLQELKTLELIIDNANIYTENSNQEIDSNGNDSEISSTKWLALFNDAWVADYWDKIIEQFHEKPLEFKEPIACLNFHHSAS